MTTDTKDEFGYKKLNPVELRKVIADLVRENEMLVADKKEYNAGANDTIKAVKARIKVAVESLTAAEHTAKTQALEEDGNRLLKSV